MEEQKKTDIQLQQEYLFGLLQKHILSIKGQILPNEDNIPEEFISKEDIASGIVKLLNEFGEVESKDIKEHVEENNNKDKENNCGQDKG